MWRSVRFGLTAFLATVMLAGCGSGVLSLPDPPGAVTSLTDADGYIADSVSPFDESLPAVSRLDDALRAAIQTATTDAAAEGVELRLNSGWRSERYQLALLADAVREHGSEAEARKWVASPRESRHVSGDAVDIGPAEASDWLIRHGAGYGLCQIYANERWHFELATQPGADCPRLLDDAASG